MLATQRNQQDRQHHQTASTQVEDGAGTSFWERIEVFPSSFFSTPPVRLRFQFASWRTLSGSVIQFLPVPPNCIAFQREFRRDQFTKMAIAFVTFQISGAFFSTLFGAAPHTALRTSDHSDCPLLPVQKLKPYISTTNGADRALRSPSQER